MEFFEEIGYPDIDVETLKDRLQIASLPVHCQSIDTVIVDHADQGEIYCLWGQFTVSRESIKNGVRFALLSCPHALAWTVAYHASDAKLAVHCTIDDRQESEEFVQSIEQFVADWAVGLRRALQDGRIGG